MAKDHGGYFNKIDFGDKGGIVLVLFGAPRGHENDLQRACAFLLSLRAGLDSDPDSAQQVSWRAGVTYGPVYAGLIGSTQRCEYTAIGVTVNLSARMALNSDWGEIAVSESVQHKLEHSYRFEYQGANKYKGFSSAIPVYQLKGPGIYDRHMSKGPLILQ
ncbi:adenylate/guanylate cyclase domain-containing protein [bacterium]|nr:adenylate/guanylate cyclase domain-containing protein [bacterium]